MKKFKFKKGDEVYIHSSNNWDKDFTSVVTKSGTRFITIKALNIKFYVDSLTSENGNYTIYPSIEDYKAETERKEKYIQVMKQLQSFDVYNNISIEALDKISEIIKEERK